MKEKLNLRNAIIWTCALMALLVFLFSFGVGAKLVGTIEGDYINVTMSHAIWGCRSMGGTADGHFVGEINKKAVVSVPALIGVILLLLASGGLVAITFLVKEEKTKKILIFVAAGVILVGSILLFFASEAVWSFLIEYMHEEGMDVTREQIKSAYSGTKAYSPGGIFLGILGIFASGGVIASQFIKDIQFIKSK